MNKPLAFMVLLAIAAAVPAFGGPIYVSDQGYNSIQIFDSTTGALTGSITVADPFATLTGVAVGADGRVYVADSSNNVIDRFTSDGTFLDTFANTGLDQPTGMAFGPDGNLYVANSGSSNGYIVRFDSTGTLVDPTPFVPSSTNISYPDSLAFGPDGNLYFGDQALGVNKVILSTGVFSNLIPFGCPSTPFTIPQGLTFSAGGNLLVADAGVGCGFVGSGIYKYDTDGNFLGNFITVNLLNSPRALVFGPDGNLYVSDQNQAMIALFDSNGNQLPDFVPTSGTGGPLNIPTYLAFGPSAAGVPEPATVGLIGLGLFALVLRRR